MAILLLAGALLHGLRRMFRRLKEQGQPTVIPSFFLILTVIVALGLSYQLARPMIEERVADTRNQLSHMREIGGFGARAQLYGDTWRMANDRFWFGWGLGSYGTVFALYNTQHASDNLPQYYEDAHSDWLQLLAETGAIGTALFLALLVAPLLLLRRLEKISSLPLYLFAGCGPISLYAWVEFPFSNPAVALTFWTCYFCAVRWVQLESHKHSG
jgi:O-antigen ligase